LSPRRGGIPATVDGENVSIIRPHYGLRRKHRTILISSPTIAWCTDYRRSRHLDVLRRDDCSVAYQQRGAERLVDPGMSAAEVSLILAIADSSLIETSTLWNYFTSSCWIRAL
jgi:hypothetical protein